MSIDLDQLALDAASEVMGRVYGPIPKGGSVQLKAQVQNAILAALQQAEQAATELEALRKRCEAVEAAFRDLRWGYVNLLETGRDRIMDLGGVCDPVDVMERSDPYLRCADQAIAAAQEPSHG